MLAIWSLVPLLFVNPSWTSRSFQFMYCWSLAWRILSTALLACEMSAIVRQFEHSLALPFFGIGTKTDHFQSCGHCWVFQICCHIEWSTFTASSFRIWNSSTGIPSPPLALFLVMLPKAHLTSHTRMSGSRWVITPSWLTGKIPFPPLKSITNKQLKSCEMAYTTFHSTTFTDWFLAFTDDSCQNKCYHSCNNVIKKTFLLHSLVSLLL